MSKVSKTNKRIIVAFSLILMTLFCVASPSSVKADAGNNIVINYSAYQTGMLYVKFGEYSNIPEAPDGSFVFFVVNMNIENNGYDSFNTAPAYFYIITNNAKYNFDMATYKVNNWTTVDILNGGTFTGTLVFQIPENSIVSNIGYSGYDNQSQSFNIVWTSVKPYPTPTPTSTSTPSPTVPEFSWLTILPILLAILIVLVMIRKTVFRNITL